MKALIEKIYGIFGRFTDLPLLLIRLTLGAIFLQTGYGKLTNFAGTVEFFSSLGIPFPVINAALASVTEFVGGALLIAGLMTRLVSIPLTVVMVVAILTAQLPELEGLSDFVRLSEWDYILFFILLICTGAGRVSVDYLVKRGLKK